MSCTRTQAIRIILDVPEQQAKILDHVLLSKPIATTESFISEGIVKSAPHLRSLLSHLRNAMMEKGLKIEIKPVYRTGYIMSEEHRQNAEDKIVQFQMAGTR